MDSNELLMNWSNLSYAEIEERLKAKDREPAADQLFGPEEMAKIQAVVSEPPTRGEKQAVVLLPGIMGSLLRSVRGMTNLTWINPLLFLQGEVGYLWLNEDGTADAHPEIDNVAIGTEKLTYLKFALTLRKSFNLFEFPYDWRRSIEYNGDLLAGYLERWASDQPERRFTLVAHSMGGLVSRAYLARHPTAAETRVERLIMLGTPHYGAAGAVEAMVMGNNMTAIAARLNGDNDLIGLMRNLPSVYQLVPAPPELFPAERPYPISWDVYDASAWRVEGIRQDYLDAARDFYGMLDDADPQVELVEIAGCNIDTVVDIRRTYGPNEQPKFDSIRVAEGADSGDGTVPLWSAQLPGAHVCYVQEVHRDMPKRRSVVEATLDLVRDGRTDLLTTLPEPQTEWVRAAPERPEVEADNVRRRIEAGMAREEDLSKLFFAL